MSESSVIGAIEQVKPGEAGELLREWLRGEMRSLIADILADEVTELCGPPYRPTQDTDCRHAGGTQVDARIDGVNKRIRKPRVRRHGDVGSHEVRLQSYEALRRADDLRDHIQKATAVGVSARDQQVLYADSVPSRSAVSRAWVVEGRERIESLHRLGAPSTLHTTLLSTNCIENPFRNVRAKIGRVKRWRAETDQAGQGQ